MIIVKIGGSVLSDKRRRFHFREDTVRGIADEISKLYPREKFVIVHGGGSFGHPLAKEFRIRDGLIDRRSRTGFVLTHLAMLELTSKVIKCFLDKNIPAFPISSSSIFITKEGRIIRASLDIVKEALDREFVPVLFGDVSFDMSKGIEIVSGDEIILHLAREFRPKKVIFLMDVDGIYDRFPDGQLIRRLKAREIDSLVLEGSAGIDVTGGIKKKLEVAKDLVNYSEEVWFVNGLVRGRLSSAIRGDCVGTLVTR
ncbi:hypothetical protein PNA2_0206 [Pyrococcus sp. NA2]|uniref:isopentenyl phosphate kinase n=1 Tax=Pyrococcus sp. (strain NA2) TaxID=342949 RepID=UPI000209AF4F|nr:isopentenyl phosphate kinase [Pyrococcus sp. NA2]AEC51124.1 hypothetical protein PNA2_0206 [Pyrococcus sp. NA2]